MGCPATTSSAPRLICSSISLPTPPASPAGNIEKTFDSEEDASPLLESSPWIEPVDSFRVSASEPGIQNQPAHFRRINNQGKAVSTPTPKPSRHVQDLRNKLAPQRPNPACFGGLPPGLAKAVLEPVTVAPNRNRFTVDNVVVLKRNELLSSVSAGLASIDTGEDEAVVEKNTVAKRKTAEEERRIYHQEREEKRLERVMMEKEKLAQQVQEMRAARKAEAARKAACEEKQALDSLFEDDEPEHEAITPEQLKFEAELEAAIWTSFDEGEEGPSCPPKDEIKDAISTIPAQKRKFTSIVTTASIPTPTPIPASAKKEKKNKMPTQEALQRAIPAQGINLRELAKEFSIDGKDMSKAVKFEARVKMWFRKEGGAVFA